jgi:hypothetical protein
MNIISVSQCIIAKWNKLFIALIILLLLSCSPYNKSYSERRGLMLLHRSEQPVNRKMYTNKTYKKRQKQKTIKRKKHRRIQGTSSSPNLPLDFFHRYTLFN